MDTSTLVAQALSNGLIIGLLYLLMAVGFTLVFGVMRIVNFAHSEFYMLGAFAAYVLVSDWHMPFLAAVGVAFALAVVFGWLVEWLVLKPFRAGPPTFSGASSPRAWRAISASPWSSRTCPARAARSARPARYAPRRTATRW